MDAEETCVLDGSPPIVVCISDIASILYNYMAGRYNLSSDPHPQDGIRNYITMEDAKISFLFFVFFYVIDITFHSFIPSMLLRYCPSIPRNVCKKVASNISTIFDKIIIVSTILYVLYIESNCSVIHSFSSITSSAYPHSSTSYYVHLFAITNYIFKLYEIILLGIDITHQTLHVIHHFIAIYVLSVSFIYNQ